MCHYEKFEELTDNQSLQNSVREIGRPVLANGLKATLLAQAVDRLSLLSHKLLVNLAFP